MSLHEANVAREALRKLSKSTTVPGTASVFLNGFQAVCNLEAELINKADELRDLKATPAKSRQGREVTELRAVVSNLCKMLGYSEEIQQQLRKRLAVPLTKPEAIIQDILQNHTFKDEATELTPITVQVARLINE